MKINITYPPFKKKKLTRKKLIEICKWPFLLGIYASAIINICVGGKPWSVIVVWSIWIIWSLFFATDLVDYNRVTQCIKAVYNSIILLILLNWIFSLDLFTMVIPIVSFSGLLLIAILFISDMERQKNNIGSIIMTIIITIIASIVGLSVWKSTSSWPIIVLFALAVAFLLVCIIALGRELNLGLKKYFHLK